MHWTHIGEYALDDVVVLALDGQMTLDAEEQRLREVVDDILAAGRRRIVLDLEAVPYVDSLGIGEIVRVYSAVVRAGGALRLAAVTRRVREVLEATQLAQVLGVCGTVAEAAASLTSEKP